MGEVAEGIEAAVQRGPSPRRPRIKQPLVLLSYASQVCIITAGLLPIWLLKPGDLAIFTMHIGVFGIIKGAANNIGFDTALQSELVSEEFIDNSSVILVPSALLFATAMCFLYGPSYYATAVAMSVAMFFNIGFGGYKAAVLRSSFRDTFFWVESWYGASLILGTIGAALAGGTPLGFALAILCSEMVKAVVVAVVGRRAGVHPKLEYSVRKLARSPAVVARPFVTQLLAGLDQLVVASILPGQVRLYRLSRQGANVITFMLAPLWRDAVKDPRSFGAITAPSQLGVQRFWIGVGTLALVVALIAAIEIFRLPLLPADVVGWDLMVLLSIASLGRLIDGGLFGDSKVGVSYYSNRWVVLAVPAIGSLVLFAGGLLGLDIWLYTVLTTAVTISVALWRAHFVSRLARAA